MIEELTLTPMPGVRYEWRGSKCLQTGRVVSRGAFDRPDGALRSGCSSFCVGPVPQRPQDCLFIDHSGVLAAGSSRDKLWGSLLVEYERVAWYTRVESEQLC